MRAEGAAVCDDAVMCCCCPCCRAEVKMAASNDFGKAVAKAAFVALPFLGPMVAGAKIDYEGACLKLCLAEERSDVRIRRHIPSPILGDAVSFFLPVLWPLGVAMMTMIRRGLPGRWRQGGPEQRQRARLHAVPRPVPHHRRQDRLPRPLQVRR